MTPTEKIKALSDDELRRRLRLMKEGIPEALAPFEARINALNADLKALAVKVARAAKKASHRKSARK